MATRDHNLIPLAGKSPLNKQLSLLHLPSYREGYRSPCSQSLLLESARLICSCGGESGGAASKRKGKLTFVAERILAFTLAVSKSAHHQNYLRRFKEYNFLPLSLALLI